MKKKNYFLLFGAIFSLQIAIAQPVTVNVNALSGRKPISPYIFGKNNNIPDDPASPTTSAQWKLMREAGLKFTRENGGNNDSKYNWRKKITCHPDWYNNIYASDWDYAARKLQDSLPGVQGEWGFQLIGKAASNTLNNFDDWSYNGSTYWSGVLQNLAGGGTVNGAGGPNALVNGDINLYLQPCTSDSTVGILDHWFGTGGLGYNSNSIKYWSMDNEPDIWNSTHDDVMPTEPTAEAFMQLYFAVAKKARAKFPNIKLVGPVPASEWQWYSWNNAKITGADGLQYTWLEFFIKRISEEEAASGVRLLDVIDIHSYPNETNNADILQLHRIYFDTTYSYPGANGVKTIAASGWDPSITQEFIFERCNRWLNHYMGPGHGVTCSVSEYGFTNNNANVSSVSYGSVLGTFADNGVEFFSPWYWYPGMWESLHLFSHYGKTTRVASVSTDETNVSGYSSVNTANDSMTVILVNRSLSSSKTVTVNISNFAVPNGTYTTKRLSGLPASETFVSNAVNALSTGTATVASNSLTITLPSLSTTAVILKGVGALGINDVTEQILHAKLYPNPAGSQNVYIDLSAEKINDVKVQVYSTLGQLIYSKQYDGQNPSVIEIPSNMMTQGVYIVNLSSSNGKKWSSRLVKM
ncbi:MAG: glycoside hydrolase family 44 protein [Bacteroidia bacterium]